MMLFVDIVSVTGWYALSHFFFFLKKEMRTEIGSWLGWDMCFVGRC